MPAKVIDTCVDGHHGTCKLYYWPGADCYHCGLARGSFVCTMLAAEIVTPIARVEDLKWAEKLRLARVLRTMSCYGNFEYIALPTRQVIRHMVPSMWYDLLKFSVRVADNDEERDL